MHKMKDGYTEGFRTTYISWCFNLKQSDYRVIALR